MIQQRLLFSALCFLAAGMATACAEEESSEFGSGDRSDDLAGRALVIVSSASTTVSAGQHTATMLLEEKDDSSVTIYSEGYIYDSGLNEFEIAQSTSWVSFNTTLYGFVLSYREYGSTGEWATVTADGSLDNYTIFESVKGEYTFDGFQLEGTGISFENIAFDDNGTDPANRFTTFNALTTDLPSRIELKIIPIPVWNFGDFEVSYEVDFDITEL
ncbi:MAG: hypothetical protein JKY56_13255 [Kofleriaceae bacterium]|nr:hypothetical protein [Kofleriaceae bacterium]